MLSRVWLFTIVVAGSAGIGRAECWNTFLPCPTSPVTTLSIVIKGNVVNNLNLAAIQTDPTVNPFANVDVQMHINPATDANLKVTAALDGNGNTVVTFSGKNPVTPPCGGFVYGTSKGNPHVGLDSSLGSGVSCGGPALMIIAHQWGAGPGIGAASVDSPASSGCWRTLFLIITDPGQQAGEWHELPCGCNRPAPNVIISNNSNAPITLSNVGYQLSPTLIPLDDLNFGNDPPPGQPGSNFTPLPQYNGTTLQPGGSTTIDGGMIPPSCGTPDISFGPPAELVTSANAANGLSSVITTASQNANVAIDSFNAGTNGPVTITATQITPGHIASFTVKLTDLLGNTTTCDPVTGRLQVPEGEIYSAHQFNRTLAMGRYNGVAAIEGTLLIKNGQNGLTSVLVVVDGNRRAVFEAKDLASGEARTIDISGALHAGNNVVTVLGYGDPGAEADIAIFGNGN